MTTIAVVAQTKALAQQLARELNLDDRWVFGARIHPAFEGLRAEVVYIDANARIPDRFIATIYSTVRRHSPVGGRVVLVTARRAPEFYDPVD